MTTKWTDEPRIGIIGGSGLDNPDILLDKQEVEVETPFGKPSDGKVTLGKINGVSCALLARHGKKHELMPTNVNYRANMYALKKVGCSRVMVTTACGSLREDYKPGDIVLIDDFIDRTTKRATTLFDGSSSEHRGVCHLPMNNVFNEKLRHLLLSTCQVLGYSHHPSGTMVTIEGPRFSSRAESKMFRNWGGDLVNMSTIPEVLVANELGLVYASIALVTDYDCWREGEEVCTVEEVIRTFKDNAHKAVELLKTVIPKVAECDWSDELTSLREKVKNNTM